MSKDFQTDLAEILSWQEDAQPNEQLARSIELTRQAGIVTYDDLFRVIRSDNTAPELRVAACLVLRNIGHRADKRRTAGPLIAALQSDNLDLKREAARAMWYTSGKPTLQALLIALQDLNDNLTPDKEHIRRDIMYALVKLKEQRAVAPIIAMALDKNRDNMTRIDAIQVLSGTAYGIDTLLHIMSDESEARERRGDAAEQLGSCHSDEDIGRILPHLVAALSHPIADLRFWATFALTSLGRYLKDPQLFIDSGALAALVHIANEDMEILSGWWAVREEAIAAIEEWYRHFRIFREKKSFSSMTHFLGPVRSHDQKWTRSTAETQPDELLLLPTFTAWHITSVDFMKHMSKRWQDVRFNTRQPATNYLLVDFELTLDDKLITGGLQRGGHTLTLNSDHEPVIQFALWWKSVFPAEHKLYLDLWAYGYADLDRFTTEAEILNAIETHPYQVYGPKDET